jgi:hypothetical protein
LIELGILHGHTPQHLKADAEAAKEVGIMEWWNTGILGKQKNRKRRKVWWFSLFPLFHHSNISTVFASAVKFHIPIHLNTKFKNPPVPKAIGKTTSDIQIAFFSPLSLIIMKNWAMQGMKRVIVTRLTRI